MGRRLIMTALSAVALPAFAQDLSLSYRPVWPGLGPGQGVTPYIVEISNTGSDTVGLLTVSSNQSQYGIPIELPKGAHKTVFAYVSAGSWQEPKLALRTDRGTLERPVEDKLGDPSAYLKIGIVSQVEGLLPATQTAGKKRVVRSSTCKPEDAPVRSAGYEPARLVVLGEGAERLTESACRAIERHVLRGGTLVLPGGASSPWLNAAEWSRLCPVVLSGTENVTLGSLGAFGRAPDGPVTVSLATPRPGSRTTLSQGDRPLIVERPYGLGKIVFLAFNPFEGPVRVWAGKAAMFIAIRGPGGSWLADSYQDDEPPVREPDSDNDPFQARLPSALLVIGVLGAFVVAAVPLNFLVLGRLQRKELAWVTLPVTSLAFSAVIFSSAGQLYSAHEAKAVQGRLVVQDGERTGVFSGTQKFFFPRAGAYDLRFKGVEQVLEHQEENRLFGAGQGLAGAPSILDVGEMAAPSVQVTNLSFREYEVVQEVPIAWHITNLTTLKTVGDQVLVRGSLRSDCPSALTGVRLRYKGDWLSLPDIQPQSEVKVEGRFNHHDSVGSVGNPETLQLYAEANGLEVGGPATRQSVKLLYTWEYPR